ncbi:unnamed protein product [Heterotrigona itama]|uniref:Uncharacterized protein n=1 Tax=Heterotrigona itama TaxID=395501 RepID=A0A6V7GZ64_9HYME|nr:unnamed protein product [Heterotrigona itama]
MDVYSSWHDSRAPQGPLKRMSEFLRTAGKIRNGGLLTRAPRVITSQRTVTDCAKTIKERDSGLEISERPTCMLYRWSFNKMPDRSSALAVLFC